MLRPVQGPGHTTTLHPRGSDVLADAFHRAAADWQVLLSVLRVVHALAVCLEVVDLALYLVTVLAVSVTQPFQFVDHRCPARSQSGTPLLQLPIELRRTLPVEELAHRREVLDGVAEIRDVHTVGVPDICHTVPNPLRSIADEHQAQFRQVRTASVHLHPDTLEELVGMLDAQHIRSFGAARLLSSLIPLQFRYTRHLDISELAVVSLSFVIIYAFVTLRRYVPRIDTHQHRASDLIGHRPQARPLLTRRSFCALLSPRVPCTYVRNVPSIAPFTPPVLPPHTQ